MLGRIDELLGIGCSIEVTCDQVAIDRQTFYNWKGRSLHLRELADRHPFALATEKDILYLVFFDVIRQAQSRAHVLATQAFQSGLVDYRYLESEAYTYTETRLRKGKDGEEIPYTYQELRFRDVERVIRREWRAGEAFLKRRDPATWNPPTKIEFTWEEIAVDYIQKGEVEFWDMVEEFDDYDLVASLFSRAGKVAPPRTG